MEQNILVMDAQHLEETLLNALDKFFQQREAAAAAAAATGVDGDELLERSDVCERYHISKGTLNNWVNRGMVHPLKLGRRVLFPISELLRAEAEGLHKFAR